MNGTETTTDYVLSGKKLVHLTQGSNKMHFFYDASGCPAMVKFNGTVYRYVHNLQGDVVGILNSAGTLVVEYKYDAWGRLISATNSTLANLNPFRYRSYVYDSDAGMYYLNSRYYNPEWCRFINADSIVGNIGVLNHNLFAYCKNNSVALYDPSGKYSVASTFISEDQLASDPSIEYREVERTEELLDGVTIITRYELVFVPYGSDTFDELNSRQKMDDSVAGFIAAFVEIGSAAGLKWVGKIKALQGLSAVMGIASKGLNVIGAVTTALSAGVARAEAAANNELIDSLKQAQRAKTGIVFVRHIDTNIATGDIVEFNFSEEWSTWRDLQ